MHYCGGCGQLLMSRTAHCHHYGCGWENPMFVAEEVALATGNLELAEDLALMNGDFGTAVAIEIAEDLGGW